MNLAVIGNWKGDGFKKSTGSGIVSTYTRKVYDKLMTAVVPSEKFKSVVASVGVSNAVVFCLDESTEPKIAGEMALLSKFTGSPVYAIDYGFYMWEALKGTPLYSAKRIESLMEVSGSADRKSGPLVHIDQSFVVSGKGNVVLGFLKSGTVRKHDVLYSTMGEVMVKSIQINGKDVEEATAGSRIGFLVKSKFQVPDHDILVPSPHEFSDTLSFSATHRFSSPPQSFSIMAGTMSFQASMDNDVVRSKVPVGGWELFAFSNDVFPRILGIVRPADTAQI